MRITKSFSALDRIVAQKSEDLLLRKKKMPFEEIKGSIAPSDFDFFKALSAPGLSLIAEMKKSSPSKGLIRADFDPEKLARIYEGRAQAISVLCDEPFFGGKLENLSLARKNTGLPLLCKDFILEPYQIWEARSFGADAVLLMASLLDPIEIEEMLQILRSLNMSALVEVHSEEELLEVLGTSARIVGVNSRNLRTLEIDENVFSRLGPLIHIEKRLLVAESGLKDREAIDKVRPLADAVLIGSALMEAPDIAEKLWELGY
ncbi:MAG TPA: indole-3-glycerol-phosphate synthase TrpC [Cyanobacteria bacterium UBA8530]|nr:indole-3-glycerol-phosphate synthase TrpC [Cyanobacteria bacterium UBA8530]